MVFEDDRIIGPGGYGEGGKKLICSNMHKFFHGYFGLDKSQL